MNRRIISSFAIVAMFITLTTTVSSMGCNDVEKLSENESSTLWFFGIIDEYHEEEIENATFYVYTPIRVKFLLMTFDGFKVTNASKYKIRSEYPAKVGIPIVDKLFIRFIPTIGGNFIMFGRLHVDGILRF